MTTDDRGVYRIYGLMPGSYMVGVMPPAVGATSETRQLSDDEMRAAMMDLKRPATTPPPPWTRPGEAASFRRRRPDRCPPRRSQAARSTTRRSTTPAPSSSRTPRRSPSPSARKRPGIDFAMLMVPTSRIDGSVVLPDGTAPARVQISLATCVGQRQQRDAGHDPAGRQSSRRAASPRAATRSSRRS